MCIIVLKTPEGQLTDEILTNCFINNNHGGGFAYTLNNNLIIDKGYFKLNDFIKAYHQIKQIADSNILIHCRISTSGLTDAANCHPYFINKNICLAHNGILSGVNIPKNSKINDTQIFINEYLKNKPDLMQDNHFLKLLSYAISGSKFVIMDSTGNYKIINEDAGHWSGGNWYSNNTYKNYYDYWSGYNWSRCSSSSKKNKNILQDKTADAADDFDEDDIYSDDTDALYWLLYDLIDDFDEDLMQYMPDKPTLADIILVYMTDKDLIDYPEFYQKQNEKLSDFAYDLFEMYKDKKYMCSYIEQAADYV